MGNINFLFNTKTKGVFQYLSLSLLFLLLNINTASSLEVGSDDNSVGVILTPSTPQQYSSIIWNYNQSGTGGGNATPAGNDGEVQFNNNGVLGASNKLYWDNSVRELGIGTNNPNAKLTVYDGAGVEDTTLNLNDNFKVKGDGILYFGGSASQGKLYGTSGKVVLEGVTDNNLSLYANDNEVVKIQGDGSTIINNTLYVNNNGNVGIGTSNPVDKLEINDVDKNNLTLYDDANLRIMTTDALAVNKGGSITLGGVAISPSDKYGFASIKGAKENSNNGDLSGYLSLYTSQAGIGSIEKVRITSTGNVGIGNPTPASKLQVDGSVDLNKTLYVNGGKVGIGTSSPTSKLVVNSGSSNNISHFINSNLVNPFSIIGGLNIGEYWRGSFIGQNIDLDIITGKPKVTSSGYSGISIGFADDNTQGYIGLFTSTNTTSGANLLERMRVTSSGNIGIGNSTPASKLQVDGSVDLNKTLYINGNGYVGIGKANPIYNLQVSGSAPTLVVEQLDSANASGNIGFKGSGAGLKWTISTNQVVGTGFEFNEDGSTNRMYIAPGGNVGIGTTGPGAILDTQQSTTDFVGFSTLNTNGNVSLATSNAIRIGITNSAGASYARILVQENANDDFPSLTFGVQNAATTTPTTRMTITSLGRVGIRTTNPTHELNVVGNTNITGNITAANLLTMAAGNYTPTLTNTANLDASTTYAAHYMRVGNVVTVSGRVDIDPTLTATTTRLSISLPIASNLGATYECGGTAFAPNIAAQGAGITGNITADTCDMVYKSTDVTNQEMDIIFNYQIL